MISNILESIYRSWVLRRNKAFLNLLEYNPKAKALDLGCGEGGFTEEVKKELELKLFIV